ncbi:hypothetical protein ABZ897_53760 [Nonomuraea sp. NPDC046802]|uniref:hypothetical protein n=1 Tax=Nonomuraea sp. NPDC046802 TaxID=3154919 RepID=UPI0034100759
MHSPDIAQTLGGHGFTQRFDLDDPSQLLQALARMLRAIRGQATVEITPIDTQEPTPTCTSYIPGAAHITWRERDARWALTITRAGDGTQFSYENAVEITTTSTGTDLDTFLARQASAEGTSRTAYTAPVQECWRAKQTLYALESIRGTLLSEVYTAAVCAYVSAAVRLVWPTAASIDLFLPTFYTKGYADVEITEIRDPNGTALHPDPAGQQSSTATAWMELLRPDLETRLKGLIEICGRLPSDWDPIGAIPADVELEDLADHLVLRRMPLTPPTAASGTVTRH